MNRFALYGMPGAGKSTVARMLLDAFHEEGRPALTLKIAAPLYELQALIYQVAGMPLVTPYRQDGLLLNDLGAHLRRINPDALTGTFAHRVQRCAAEQPDAVMVCDDMRAPDADALLRLGFTLVEVWAPDEMRRARKSARGDLSPGADDHSTEVQPACDPHIRIVNDGRLEDLRTRTATLARQVLL
ncbi:hypothetical protein [Microtetraspora malaysiensis]|uniref:AAA+ ATPase domain-containing protein n=1 Tax=Microtetraspora malaysiensis TaxID=161358 RepID=A0ABW6T3H4_9ACTN